MATAEVTEQKPVLVEEDDEFEEFVEKDWKEEAVEDSAEKQWQADWDEEDIQDDFCQQLRAELEKGAGPSGAATSS